MPRDAPPTATKEWTLHRVRARLLEHAPRRRVYDGIKSRPGIHLRGLARELGMPLGTVEHHVHQLERNDLVGSRREGRHRALFVQDDVDPLDLQVLHFLRQPVAARILATLAGEPEVARRELAERLPHDASTLAYHLRRLHGAGLVDRLSVGRVHYYKASEPERLARLLEQAHGAVEADDAFRHLLDRTPAPDPPGRAAPVTRQR